MKNLPFEISNQTGVAQINITGPITWWEEDSDSFIDLVDSLLAQGVTKARLYICSGGGSMPAAAEIGNQLKRFDEVTCNLGSLVASSAAFLPSYCTTVIAAKNTVFMIHNPEMITVIKSLTDIDKVKDIYTIYLDNLINDLATKSKQTKEQITAWLSAETWMNAELAKSRGFIDEIEDRVDKTVPNGLENLLKNFKHAPLNLLNALLETEPKNEGVQNNNQLQNMKDLLKKLGLPENATEADALAKLEEIQKVANQVNDLKIKNLVALGAKKGLPENAVKSMFAGSGEGAEAIINSLPDVANAAASADGNPDGKVVNLTDKPDSSRLANALQNHVTNATKKVAEGRENWTIQDWEEKDLAGIQNLKKTDKAAYVAIFNRGVDETYHITESMI
jgi:ATP-dependent protease ClpP protease subunit